MSPDGTTILFDAPQPQTGDLMLVGRFVDPARQHPPFAITHCCCSFKRQELASARRLP
jgi:hypothetical protein